MTTLEQLVSERDSALAAYQLAEQRLQYHNIFPDLRTATNVMEQRLWQKSRENSEHICSTCGQYVPDKYEMEFVVDNVTYIARYYDKHDGCPDFSYRRKQ